MSLSERFDLIVFDFDGTLCDSADVKTKAFRLLYLDEEGPEFADRVREYHLEHAGISRYDKIRYVEETMLGRPPSDVRIEEVADRFGAIVEEQVIASPLFFGVVDFLEHQRGSAVLAIASATPTAELRRIVAAKGIAGYFAAVEGSPRSKGEILVSYVDRFDMDPDRIVMIGDQPSDLQAAEDAGSAFIGVGSSTEWEAEPGFPIVATLAEIDDVDVETSYKG